MKRINNLYEKIYDKNNIRSAIYCSAKGKSKRQDVIKILDNQEYYVETIYNMLKNKTHYPSKCKPFSLYDVHNKKERIIYKPKYFPDQIIHFCLMNVLEPILIKKMYLYSCGSIPGRGTSFGQKNIRKWLDNDKNNTKYCLKLDIRKFYPSIDQDIMYNKFVNIIKDKEALWLIKQILSSTNNGLPIGFYTSGWFSNFF